jgi:hypothetical protein
MAIVLDVTTCGIFYRTSECYVQKTVVIIVTAVRTSNPVLKQVLSFSIYDTIAPMYI